MSKRKKSPPPENLAIDSQPYQPLGAAEDLFYCHEREVLLAGPAGTGKSGRHWKKCFCACKNTAPCVVCWHEKPA